jgi:hypothetical protein
MCPPISVGLGYTLVTVIIGVAGRVSHRVGLAEQVAEVVIGIVNTSCVPVSTPGATRSRFPLSVLLPYRKPGQV